VREKHDSIHNSNESSGSDRLRQAQFRQSSRGVKLAPFRQVLKLGSCLRGDGDFNFDTRGEGHGGLHGKRIVNE